MEGKFTPSFKSSLSKTFYEYIQIMLPIAVYVFLEANHQNSVSYFFTSPEWAIGTIFLSFNSTFNYFKDIIKKEGVKINEHLLSLFPLIALIICVFATLNAYWSMSKENSLLIIGRIALLFFSSIIFFLLMTKPDEFKKHVR
jgi:hypothetical protein